MSDMNRNDPSNADLMTLLLRLTSKVDQIDGRLDQVDGRLDQIDGRLDQIDGRLYAIDSRLARLELYASETARQLNVVKRAVIAHTDNPLAHTSIQ